MGERERERKVIRRSSSFPTIARLMLIPVAGLLLILLWSFIASHLPEPSPQPKKEAKPVVRAAVVPRVTPPPAPPPARHGEIVLILDDVAQDAAIRTQLQALAAAAQEKGVAVGIGHMYPSTIRVLTADAPALRGRGIRFVRASAAVE